jgi:cell division septation protein DedD
MRDYEEKSYYEIQLDNKQLILVFLAAVTVCALIFVLGVMVGKGQKEADLAAIAKPEPKAVKTERDTTPPEELKPLVSEEPKEVKTEKKVKSKGKETTGDQYTFYDLDKSEEKAQDLKPSDPVKTAAGADTSGSSTIEPKQTDAKPADVKTMEAKPPEKVTEPSVQKPQNDAKYTVQIMATPSRERAEEKLKLLKSQGFAPFLDEHKTESGSVFRVRVGRFSDGESARAMASRLKKELKLEPWVTTLE